MVSPFAAWEDEKRRRRRIALGLESDTRPQMARRGLSREELIALADAEAEAEAQRIASPDPAQPPSAPVERRPRGFTTSPIIAALQTFVPQLRPRRPSFEPLVPESALEHVPEGPLRTVAGYARQLTSPADLELQAITAGLGPTAAASLRGGGAAARFLARVAEPVVRGPFPVRLAAEEAIGLGAVGAGQETVKRLPADWPDPAKTAVGLGASLAGGVLAGGAIQAAPGAVRGATKGAVGLAEGMGQANVGNVLLPPAAKRVTKPLIYEDLAPIERRLYGVQGPRVRLSEDELVGARDYLYGPADPATGLRPGSVVSPEDTARIQAFEERYRGTSHLARRRQEVAKVLAKYEPSALEKFTTGGPTAQAGFGGEMGPGQVARGAAEQPRMAQAPLSEIAASEADRIAQARAARQTPSAPAAAALTEQAASSPPARPLSAPRSVATSRPRYRDVEPRFESDFDKAVYIVTNPGASVRHPEILAWVQSAAPKGFDLPGAGRAVRASIKSLYQPSQPLNVPMQNVTLRAAPPAAAPPGVAWQTTVQRGKQAPVVVSQQGAAAPPAPPPTAPPPAGRPPPGVPPAAAVPPAGATPPSQPTLIPPGHSGVNETLSQARAIVQRDRPGIVTRIADLVPGVKQAVHRAQPRLDQPEGMTAGWVGEGLAQGKVDTALQQTRIGHLAQLDAAFGKGASGTRDFKPAGVAFRGTPEQAKYPYVGTLADIMARPSLYSLSPTQKAVLGAIQAERSAAFNGVKSSYGLDIGEFPVEPGGVHLPSVDIEETALAMAGGERGALLRGRTKTRVYATAADRWAHDPEFRPETTVSSLLAANDMTLAYGSGHRVLTEGLGGKTRSQVIQETHPELAAKMEILQKRLTSLRATANRIGGKQAEAVDTFAQSPLDPADLATLQADLNPMVGADAVGRKGPNFGKDFKDLKEEVAQAKAAIAALRPAWEVANLKPYVFVQDGIYRYFPVKEADQVTELLKKSQNPIVRFIDNVRATAFGGDLSPISIQGATSWLSDPIGTSRFVAQGKGGLTQAGMLADMKANPESWQRFTAATGINPLGGVDLEFATGFIGKIPKAGKGWVKWNEALYRPITRLQKDVFENSYQAAVKHGLSPEQAMAVAGDDATKIIPRSNYRRLGQSSADAAHYRAALTSVSFLTQPAALMNDAVKGLVKIGTKQTITQSERFAVKRVLTLVATVEAIAIMSNTYHAQTHGLDVEQAVKDSLDPNSGKFMSLVLPNGARVGLGGPFRGIIRAVAPREVKVAGVDRPIPMPFVGLERFAKGKMGPAIRIAYDEILNKDYYGRPIRTENFPVNILQSLEYALEGAAPLTVGGAAEQVRQGATAGEVVQEVASQFMGTNYLPDDPAYAASVRWQDEFKEYQGLPTNAREAAAKRVPTRDAYRKRNPQIEAKLFIAGEISSLSTGAAKAHALTLMRQNNIKSADVKSLAVRDFDSAPHIALRRYFAQQLGEPFVSGKTR